MHFSTLNFTLLHYSAVYYSTLHCTALHCTALHCTALHSFLCRVCTVLVCYPGSSNWRRHLPLAWRGLECQYTRILNTAHFTHHFKLHAAHCTQHTLHRKHSTLYMHTTHTTLLNVHFKLPCTGYVSITEPGPSV